MSNETQHFGNRLNGKTFLRVSGLKKLSVNGTDSNTNPEPSTVASAGM